MKSNRRNFIKMSSFSALATTFSTASASTMLTPEQPILKQKLTESIYAFVVADAMGGSIENLLPEQIFEKFENWDFANQFLPPLSKKDIESGKGKGNGRSTDDALNLESLIGCYLRHKNHLNAYAYAENWVKEITEKKVWIAEKGAEMAPNDRPLWVPERYVYLRLFYNNIEPRYAGMGNWINEGFQGNILPVGAVNAGDPWRAYDEASNIGMVHTESFGVEAAAVNAAAYAAAFGKNSTIENVLKTAQMVAKDGTKAALDDALAVTNPRDSIKVFGQKVREAILPYLQISPQLLKTPQLATPKDMKAQTNIGRASRIAVVENLPVAFAALKYGEGDYLKTLKAALFYGRDGETMAAVATSLLAAIKGGNVVPEKLKKELDIVNRRNYAQLSEQFFTVIKGIHEKDLSCLNERKNLL